MNRELWEEEKRITDVTDLLDRVLDTVGIERHEGNEDTPYRMAKMYVKEFFKHENNKGIDELIDKFKTFDNPNKETTEPVELVGIKFNSMCEHHWLPFSGEFRIAYIPKDRIAGLSKIPRAVEFFSKKPQLQERITKEVGDFLYEILDPLAVFIEVKAVHGCMMCRGVESDSTTFTSYKYIAEDIDEKVGVEIEEEYRVFRGNRNE